MNIDELREYSHSIEGFLYAIALSSIRLFAAFNVLPALSTEAVSGLIRSGFIVVLGSYIAFGVPVETIQMLNFSQWLMISVKETMIGLLLGFAASTVFWTAEAVGALMDTQAEYNSVQLTNPLSGEQSTPVSHLLMQLIITIFYVLGGMVVFIGALFESFQVWPLLAPLPSLKGVSDLVFLREVDGMMTAIIKFASPAMIILVLIDLGIGLITRTADKIEPGKLSQPLKGATLMLLLALMIGIFVTQVRHALIPTTLITRMQNILPHNKSQTP
jgi:type III secretion protein T